MRAVMENRLSILSGGTAPGLKTGSGLPPVIFQRTIFCRLYGGRNPAHWVPRTQGCNKIRLGRCTLSAGRALIRKLIRVGLKGIAALVALPLLHYFSLPFYNFGPGAWEFHLSRKTSIDGVCKLVFSQHIENPSL